MATRVDDRSLLLLAVLLAIGCRNQSAADGKLPQNAAVSTLAAPAWQKLCETLGPSTLPTSEDACRRSAYQAALVSARGRGSDADIRQACTGKLTECMRTAGAAAVSAKCPPQPGTSCTATVGELESCAMAVSAYHKREASQFPACDNLSAARLKDAQLPGGSDDRDILALAPCQAVSRNCAEIFK